jgi:hypothetical protein
VRLPITALATALLVSILAAVAVAQTGIGVLDVWLKARAHLPDYFELGMPLACRLTGVRGLIMASTAACNSKSLLSVAAAAAVILLLTPIAQAQQHSTEFTSGPFEGLAGIWTGSGTVTMKDGGHERVRCSGTYTVGSGGNTMRNELSCSSDSYKVEMTTDLTQTGDQLAGNWSENTRHVAGHVTGRATPTSINARAEGDTFTALLAVITHGDRQSISIQSPGSEVSDVSVTMTRGSH